MSSLRLRAARPDEQEKALALMARFYAEEHLAFEPVAIGRAVGELLDDARLGWFLFLESGEERQEGLPAGYVVLIRSFILEFGGRQVFIDELYVEPAARGRGYGRQALALAEAICHEHGIGVLRLEVDRANSAALRLYEKAGFGRHDRFTMTKLVPAPIARS